MGILALLAFMLTVPAANWLIGNVGTVCIPDGPCLIPVAPGLMAPSGVLMIGLALVLRDYVQERLGLWAALTAIGLGACTSWLVAPPSLVIASVAAFAVAELADLSVYTPLRKRGLWLAVLASGLVGSVIDSAIFLQLAFGSLDHIAGNVIGKIWMSLLVLPVLLLRKRSA
jgi:uncharacterized PurR-regulated membrane protein YhhQ (DUF165 family)